MKAILFDLDGTLIDSIDHIVDCWQYAVRVCLGREIAREEVLPTVGRMLLDCFEEIAPGRSEELFKAYRYRQQITHDTAVKLVPHTRETLSHLRAAGLLLGVVTAKSRLTATRGLELFALSPFFSTLITREDTERHKPHPDPLLVGAGRLGIEPAHVLYVGDAVVDMQAGKAAGMRTAGVVWGAGSFEALSAAHPDYVFTEMRELLGLAPMEVANP